MKRFAISFVLIFALTSHAYGMGWFGGRHNDSGSVVKTSGNANRGTTTTTGNNNGGNSGVNNGVNNGANAGPNNNGGFIATTSTTYPVPEPSTLILLASGGGVFWYVRRKLTR